MPIIPSKTKPQLMSSIQTIHLVDVEDLERFVQEVYPPLNSYSFCDTEDIRDPHDDYAFVVTGAVDDDDDEEDIKLIISGQKVPLYRNLLLLNLLCRDGYMKPGNYLVQVMWG